MKPVVQKDKLGCGIACVAFILGKDYSEVKNTLKKSITLRSGLLCKELAKVLANFNRFYSYKYLKPKLRRKMYKNGVIVFIKRSKKYPHGHYLAYFSGQWMDPWLNISPSKNIYIAKAGFRKRLPGTPIFALFPKEIVPHIANESL